MEQLVFLLLAAVVTASIYVWTDLVRNTRAGRWPLRLEPAVPQELGLVDLLLAVAIFAVVQSAMVLILQARYSIDPGRTISERPPHEQLALLVGNAWATLVSFAAAALWVRLRHGIRGVCFGFAGTAVAADLRLGLRAFLLLAPIVYLLQLLLSLWIREKHPIIEMLEESPDPRLFLISGISVVILAPIAEEFLFRGLLQGWLERVAAAETVFDPALLFGGPAATIGPAQAAGEIAGLDEPGTDLDADLQLAQHPRPLWPIVASSLLFAAVHFPHGAAPIPLFFLALGLGYLYHRTHRLLPCVVVHFLLNSCSFIGLYLTLGK